MFAEKGSALRFSCSGQIENFAGIPVMSNSPRWESDMKSEAGKELILRLASVADVLIENFRPGAWSGLGSEMMSSPPSTIASDVPTFMCGPSGSLVMSMTPASPCTGRRLWTAGDREVGGDGLMEHGCQSTHRRLVDPVHTRGIGRPAGRIRLLEQR